MRALHAQQRGSRPSVRRPTERRKGRSDESPNRADDRYGSRRLRALYEITALLAHFSRAREKPFLALLRLITRELPLRCVVLHETIGGGPRSVVWHDPDVSPADVRTAEARARKSFADLTRRAAPAAAAPLPPPSGESGRFVTAPLVIQGEPVFGVLRLEGVAPFDEEDLEFVTAIANQVSVALDRNQARLHEIELREQAESSKAAVKALNADLERRVAERTRQLQDTIKELDAFTYSIAHDLRAPLRHVHGFSQRLLGAASDEVSKNYARRIMAASEGMDDLIRDLLAYSRLTLEEVKLAPVSLEAALAKAKAAVEDELKARGADLVIEGGLPAVMGHETTLIQALINLLSNACKFTAAGAAPRVRIKAEAHGKLVRLWVEDNGIGIAPAHQERIFGVFQRLNKAEDYPGTGIGLAVVRRALERMHGRSGVVSAPGKGSRFWIELEKAGAR